MIFTNKIINHEYHEYCDCIIIFINELNGLFNYYTLIAEDSQSTWFAESPYHFKNMKNM